MCRRCGEPDRRGSAADRRDRKRWLLKTFGDGRSSPCTWCGTTLDWATLQQDRLVPEGPYRRDNLVPSCGPCNIARTAASIPDGCEYGPVGHLRTDRYGRYPDETPATTPDRPVEAAPQDATDATEAAPIPRPRRPGERHAAKAVGLDSRPGNVGALVRAEHDHADHVEHEPLTHQAEPDAGPEPDLVVIDTADLDHLRAQHPWLFTTETTDDADTDATLRRIDADLQAAENAENAKDDRHAHRDKPRATRHDDAAERDTGFGR